MLSILPILTYFYHFFPIFRYLPIYLHFYTSRLKSFTNLNLFLPFFAVGGMNRSHRLSQGAKKVTPPSVPGFNPRASGSSFGSDLSAEREDTITRLPHQGYPPSVTSKKQQKELERILQNMANHAAIQIRGVKGLSGIILQVLCFIHKSRN